MERVAIEYSKNRSDSQKCIYFNLRYIAGKESIFGFAVVVPKHGKVFLDWEKSIYLSQEELNKIKEKLLRECKDIKENTVAIKTGISIT